MSDTEPLEERSPYNEFALTKNDLTVGRAILVVYTKDFDHVPYRGMVLEYVVASEPRVYEIKPDFTDALWMLEGMWVIDLQDSNANIEEHFLVDLGVMGDMEWISQHYVLDASDRDKISAERT